MKMLIKIFSFTLLLVCVLPLNVFAENYVCKDNQNKLFIKFDYNKKQVHSANKQIYKYNIKNNLITWNSYTERKKHKIVRTFNFKRNTGKLKIETHSLIHGLNKNYNMSCSLY